METPLLKSIQQVSEGWVNKYALTYELPNGREHIYEAVSRKNLEAFTARLKLRAKRNEEGSAKAAEADAVCIVALTPRDTVVMIREFRYPLNSWCIALPAGLIDKGETAASAAARELGEETGYALVPEAPIRTLPQPGFSSTGLTDETVQVVFCEADRSQTPHPEPSELIEVFELPRKEIAAFLEANQLPIGTRAQLLLELLKKDEAS